jgi:hypothetical protein
MRVYYVQDYVFFLHGSLNPSLNLSFWLRASIRTAGSDRALTLSKILPTFGPNRCIVFFLKLVFVSAPYYRMSDVSFAHLLINGEHRHASTGATYSVHSPYTGSLASIAAAATSEDCHAAIEAAQRAFPAWEATGYATRRDILLRATATLQSEDWQKKAALAMRAELAMPQAYITFNFVAGSGLLGSVATLVNDLKGETLPSLVPGGQVFIQRRAQGVMYVSLRCCFFFVACLL